NNTLTFGGFLSLLIAKNKTFIKRFSEILTQAQNELNGAYVFDEHIAGNINPVISFDNKKTGADYTKLVIPNLIRNADGSLLDYKNLANFTHPKYYTHEEYETPTYKATEIPPISENNSFRPHDSDQEGKPENNNYDEFLSDSEVEEEEISVPQIKGWLNDNHINHLFRKMFANLSPELQNKVVTYIEPSLTANLAVDLTQEGENNFYEYDSAAPATENISNSADNLIKYLEEHFKFTCTVAISAAGPRQNNGSDCGFFSVLNSQYLLDVINDNKNFSDHFKISPYNSKKAIKQLRNYLYLENEKSPHLNLGEDAGRGTSYDEKGSISLPLSKRIIDKFEKLTCFTFAPHTSNVLDSHFMNPVERYLNSHLRKKGNLPVLGITSAAEALALSQKIRILDDLPHSAQETKKLFREKEALVYQKLEKIVEIFNSVLLKVEKYQTNGGSLITLPRDSREPKNHLYLTDAEKAIIEENLSVKSIEEINRAWDNFFRKVSNNNWQSKNVEEINMNYATDNSTDSSPPLDRFIPTEYKEFKFDNVKKYEARDGNWRITGLNAEYQGEVINELIIPQAYFRADRLEIMKETPKIPLSPINKKRDWYTISLNEENIRRDGTTLTILPAQLSFIVRRAALNRIKGELKILLEIMPLTGFDREIKYLLLDKTAIKKIQAHLDLEIKDLLSQTTQTGAIMPKGAQNLSLAVNKQAPILVLNEENFATAEITNSDTVEREQFAAFQTILKEGREPEFKGSDGLLTALEQKLKKEKSSAERLPAEIKNLFNQALNYTLTTAEEILTEIADENFVYDENNEAKLKNTLGILMKLEKTEDAFLSPENKTTIKQLTTCMFDLDLQYSEDLLNNKEANLEDYQTEKLSLEDILASDFRYNKADITSPSACESFQTWLSANEENIKELINDLANKIAELEDHANIYTLKHLETVIENAEGTVKQKEIFAVVTAWESPLVPGQYYQISDSAAGFPKKVQVITNLADIVSQVDNMYSAYMEEATQSSFNKDDSQNQTKLWQLQEKKAAIYQEILENFRELAWTDREKIKQINSDIEKKLAESEEINPLLLPQFDYQQRLTTLNEELEKTTLSAKEREFLQGEQELLNKGIKKINSTYNKGIIAEITNNYFIAEAEKIYDKIGNLRLKKSNFDPAKAESQNLLAEFGLVEKKNASSLLAILKDKLVKLLESPDTDNEDAVLNQTKLIDLGVFVAQNGFEDLNYDLINSQVEELYALISPCLTNEFLGKLPKIGRLKKNLAELVSHTLKVKVLRTAIQRLKGAEDDDSVDYCLFPIIKVKNKDSILISAEVGNKLNKIALNLPTELDEYGFVLSPPTTNDIIKATTAAQARDLGSDPHHERRAD
ncbi:4909_t:CDS:10, partial [Funneliformis geosporum]